MSCGMCGNQCSGNNCFDVGSGVLIAVNGIVYSRHCGEFTEVSR